MDFLYIENKWGLSYYDFIPVRLFSAYLYKRICKSWWLGTALNFGTILNDRKVEQIHVFTAEKIVGNSGYVSRL